MSATSLALQSYAGDGVHLQTNAWQITDSAMELVLRKQLPAVQYNRGRERAGGAKIC